MFWKKSFGCLFLAALATQCYSSDAIERDADQQLKKCQTIAEERNYDCVNSLGMNLPDLAGGGIACEGILRKQRAQCDSQRESIIQRCVVATAQTTQTVPNDFRPYIKYNIRFHNRCAHTVSLTVKTRSGGERYLDVRSDSDGEVSCTDNLPVNENCRGFKDFVATIY